MVQLALSPFHGGGTDVAPILYMVQRCNSVHENNVDFDKNLSRRITSALNDAPFLPFVLFCGAIFLIYTGTMAIGAVAAITSSDYDFHCQLLQKLCLL